MTAAKQLDIFETQPLTRKTFEDARNKMLAEWPRRPLAEPPTLAQARAIGAVRGEASLAAAEREGFDTEGARNFVLAYLAERTSAAGEDITLAAKAAGFVPHDDRAFGAVFGTLLRRGQIECVGHVARKRGHGTAGGRVWAVAR